MACLLIGLFSTSTEETAYVWIHLESYESEKTIHSWHKLQILVTYLDHLKGNPYLNHKSSGPAEKIRDKIQPFLLVPKSNNAILYANESV